MRRQADAGRAAAGMNATGARESPVQEGFRASECAQGPAAAGRRQPAAVMHLVDTLDAGGAEMMCVQLANALAARGWEVHVCATRRGGVLEKRIEGGVKLLKLERRGRFDLAALVRLREYVRREGIRLLHAHGTSVFLGAAVRMSLPGVRHVWHDHYGGQDVAARPAWLYRGIRRWVDGAIAVNVKLMDWGIEKAGLRRDRLWLVQNFPVPDGGSPVPELPGQPGYRIVQVANVRPQKDHATMLRAMARIVQEEPGAHLLLVGRCTEDGYGGEIRALVEKLGLTRWVSLLGVREDVGAVLRGCDVGVLSSASEGLPVALLEYGEAGLGVVCTDVGDCRKVVEGCGVLVKAGDEQGMAEGVLALLRDAGRRREMGERLKRRVEQHWSREAAVRGLEGIYEEILA